MEPEFPNLQFLPRDILSRICSDVANHSFTDIRNLKLVSRHLRITANKKIVLKNLPLQQIGLFLNVMSQNRRRFDKFMKRCRRGGNLEAIYRKGLVHYFHPTSYDDQWEKGITHMAKAATNGHEEAKYVLGIILLCLGGESISKGIYILPYFLGESLLLATLRRLAQLGIKNINHRWWFDTTMIDHLKRKYSKTGCNCDGRTRLQNAGWCFYGSDNDMPVSSACSICIWDFEVCRFLL